MDHVRQHLADAVARNRPELAAAEQARLIEQVVELIQNYAPQRGRESLRMFAAGESNDFFQHCASPARNEDVPSAANAIAFLAICDRVGTVTEVIRDGIGLGPRFTQGADLSAVVSPFHLRRADRFLRAVRQDHTSYDNSLSVLGKSGIVRVFCSGFTVGSHIVVLSAMEPLAISLPTELGELVEKKPELGPILKELATWRMGHGARHASASGHAPALGASPSADIANEHRTGGGRRRLLQLAAHDLRNPISGILAACQYLLEDATRILEPHHVLVLGSIESSTRVALQLIETLAEIPTIGVGRPQLDLQPTDLASVIHEAVAEIRPIADMKNIKVVVRMKDQVPTFKGDPARLREALYAILVNVVGASIAGGRIDVSASMDAGEVHVVLHREHAAPAGESPAPAPPGKPSRRESPRKLSDVHAALLWARAKLILKAHGGGVRTDPHAAQGQSWTVTLPIAAHQHARKA
jgi:signal transduction histidine kinase